MTDLDRNHQPSYWFRRFYLVASIWAGLGAGWFVGMPYPFAIWHPGWVVLPVAMFGFFGYMFMWFLGIHLLLYDPEELP